MTDFYRASEENLRLALKATGTGVWYYDFAKQAMEIDEQTRIIFGLASDAFFSHEILFEMVHPDDRERIESFAKKELHELYEVSAEYKIIAADGKVKNISSAGRMFFDSQNAPLRIAGTFRDVTAQKLEEEKAYRLALLEQREDFMATLTHDLKTPLIAANWILQAIADAQVGPVTGEQEQLLFQLRDTNRTLLSMIQNLIELYRFERNVNNVILEETQISEILSACINDLSIFLIRRQITLTCSMPEELPPILVDPNAIRRVFQNLLDNALKFTPESGRISIVVSDADGGITISITDTGPGIALEEQARLFHRFVQGKAGRTYTPGTGLGLYLCKQIVEAHEGKISCASAAGKGAEFTVQLPRRSCNSLAEQLV